MRIAIDCRSILNPVRGELAGIGHYTHFLVRHLLRQDDENHYVLFFDDRATKGLMAEVIGSNRNVETKVLPLSRFKKMLPYAFSHRIVASAIAKTEADVFHSPTGSLPMGYARPSVITVHDLAIYAHPEWFPAGQLFSRRFVVPASVRKARRIIAVSHATARDLQRLFAVRPEKISVIHEGVEHPPVDERAAEKASPVKGDYFLYLGTVEPRKNVDGLVRAYATLAREFPKSLGKTELVVAGAKGWKADGTLKAIESANRKFGKKGPKVRLLGYVDAADKLPLMAHARAFVFPSFYEGFGLPVLEAMSLGVPVIASRTSSLPEIVGRAGILVDPEDSAELVLAMKHLLDDPARRRELGRAALGRSVEFRWERTAGETLEVYEAAARGAAPAHAGADLSRGWHGAALAEEA
jgi:glycosyltransferase involved in cell wall biosynthesis